MKTKPDDPKAYGFFLCKDHLRSIVMEANTLKKFKKP